MIGNVSCQTSRGWAPLALLAALCLLADDFGAQAAQAAQGVGATAGRICLIEPPGALKIRQKGQKAKPASAQVAQAQPLARRAQAASSLEGVKLLLEGKRLMETGARADWKAAVEKFKAACELFRKDNYERGVGAALCVLGSAYSSLGQKCQSLNALLRWQALTRPMAIA